jgi:two-component system phosphate regulon response regulator PhoB
MKTTGRVLVVDDDDSIREVVIEALSDEGYEVVGAADGQAALALLTATRNKPLSLILLDLRMAGLDGGAFAESYRRLPEPRAPVLLFSAVQGAEAYAAELGAVGTLTKPFELEELLALVERHSGSADPHAGEDGQASAAGGGKCRVGGEAGPAGRG